MANTKALAVCLALGLSVGLGACAAPDDAELGREDVSVVRSALNDTAFVTPANAQTALGMVSTSFISSIWTANAPNSQIVGQSFAQSGGAPIGMPPESRVYSTSVKPAKSPSIARDANDTMYLLVWQEDFSGTDSDIKAQMVTDDGRTENSNFGIDTDLLLETTPVVTALPGHEWPWLVTYLKNVNGSTALIGRFVDGNRTVTNPMTIIPAGIITSAVKHTVSYSPSDRQLMFTHSDFKVSFAPVETMVADSTSSLPAGIEIGGAFSQVNGRFAVSWREGGGLTSKVGVRTFLPGCRSLSCATSTQYIVSAGGAVTGLNPPMIAPLGSGFGVAVGILPASLKTIRLVSLASSGALISYTNAVTPACPFAPTGGTLGQQTTMALATPRNDASASAFLMYDTFCPQQRKIHVTGWTPGLAKSASFDVAD